METASSSSHPTRPASGTPPLFAIGIPAIVFLFVSSFVAVSLAGVPQALAGRSSTGELAFHPCTRCHPVTLGEDGTVENELPIDFEEHLIELEVHDILGEGDRACLACHDEPSSDPGRLLLPDGGLVDITGDVSRVCQRCHFEKYDEWVLGIHGKREPKCTSSGCHDPHTPSWIYVAALPPFQGTGIEVRAVSQREPFAPMAGAPVPPPVSTPPWLAISASAGAVAMLGGLGLILLGRVRR